MISLARTLRSPRLPSLPAAAVRLLELSRESNSKTGEFVRVVESDPAIAAKILKLANSSFFATRSKVASVQRAVVLLGLNTVTSMALSFSVARSSTGKGPLAHHFERYWQRSVLQGTAAQTLASRLPSADRSELFLLGLMLDIGQLALLCTAGKKYAEVLDAAEDPDAGPMRPLHEVERAMVGFDHAYVGARLLEGWQFPDEMVALVDWHNGQPVAPIQDDADEADDDETAASEATTERPTEPATEAAGPERAGIAQLVSAIGEYFFPVSASDSRERLLEVAAATMGLGPAQVDELLDEITDRFRTSAELFDADPDDLPEPSEIMAMVNEQLATKALKAEQSETELAQAKARIEQRQQEIVAEKDRLEARNRELQALATADPLTGLYNRHFLDETLQADVDLAQRTGKPIGVLFMDVDRFKQVNDVYGHQFGDVVLCEVAKTLKAHVRKSDLVARYGGEEFVVLARQPTEPGLRTLAERIRQAVSELEFAADGQPVPVTISIGAAHAIPRRVDPEIGERLIAEADAAMYDSKNGGRNRVTLRSLLSESQIELAKMVSARRFSLWLVRRQAIDAAEATQAISRSLPPGDRLGELAEEFGFLDRDQVDQLLTAQIEGNMGQRIGELAIERGYLTQPELACLLALQTESPQRIAQALVRNGCIDPPTVARLHQEYLAEILPATPARQPVGS